MFKQQVKLKNEISAQVDCKSAAKGQNTEKEAEPKLAQVGTEKLDLVKVSETLLVSRPVHLLVQSLSDQPPLAAVRQLVSSLDQLTDTYLSQLTFDCFMTRCPSLNLFKLDAPASVEGAAPGQKVNRLVVLISDALFLKSNIDSLCLSAPDESHRLKESAASTVRDFFSRIQETAVEYLMRAVSQYCIVSILSDKGRPKVSAPQGMAPLPAAPLSMNQIQPEPQKVSNSQLSNFKAFVGKPRPQFLLSGLHCFATLLCNHLVAGLHSLKEIDENAKQVFKGILEQFQQQSFETVEIAILTACPQAEGADPSERS